MTATKSRPARCRAVSGHVRADRHAGAGRATRFSPAEGTFCADRLASSGRPCARSRRREDASVLIDLPGRSSVDMYYMSPRRRRRADRPASTVDLHVPLAVRKRVQAIDLAGPVELHRRRRGSGHDRADRLRRRQSTRIVLLCRGHSY
ncbi:hypothetical protein HBB16_21740 [Pseudonocardia sp. MCCB 268]|nr:hypothetical protein [Pseudonocardia cytotoxica]